MKNALRKILALCLVVGMLFPLAACMPATPPANTTTGTQPPTTTGPQVTTDPFRTDVGTLSFSAVNDLSEYKIVVSAMASDALYAEALAFAERLAEKTGITLTVETDAVVYGQPVPTDTKEILFGKTNRAESFDSLRYNDYLIEKRGNRIVVAGGSDSALENAVEELFTVEAFFADAVLMAPNAAYAFNDAYAVDTLLLGGVDVSKYTIVRDAGSAEIAEYLQLKIREWTGHELPLKTAEADAEFYEILIGNISRDESLSLYPEGEEYVVQQLGTKLVLGGTADFAGYYATMAFLNEYVLGAPTASTLSISASIASTLFTTVPFGATNMPKEFADFSDKVTHLDNSAESAFERFLLAKEELPDEITVLEKVDVNDFPLSLQKQIYVSSKTGDDSNDGLTPETPFETLPKAISYMLGKGGGVIWVMGGTYELKDTLNISAAASGSASSPLFIKAYEDKEVTLTTTTVWPGYESGAWVPVTYYAGDNVADRIPDEVKDSGDDIYYATLADLGLTKADMAQITQSVHPQLYVGGASYSIARYPNDTGSALDLFYFTEVYDRGSVTSSISGWLSDWMNRVAASGGTLTPSSVIGWQIRVINEKDNANLVNSLGEANAQEMADVVTSWVNTGNIWCYGSLYQGWATGYYNLSVNEEGIQNWHYSEDGEMLLGGWRDDPNGITVTSYDRNGKATQKTGYYFLKSKQPCSYGAGASSNSGAGRNTFYFFNAIEMMDQPGEWFYDQETEIIYLYPTEEFFDDGAITYSGLDDYYAVKAYESNYVVFDGIDINGAGSIGMHVQQCSNMVIQNCDFSNTKTGSLYVTACTDMAVIYCNFSRNYSGRMVDFNTSFRTDETQKTLKSVNSYLQNCVFFDPLYGEDVAIFHGGAHMVISHNYFRNTVVKSGSSFEAVIEYNRFDGGSKTISDGGLMYFSTLDTRGAHCRYNLCNLEYSTHRAVYFDTQNSGGYAYGNIISTLHGVTKSAYNAWYSSSGNGNVCFGNIFMLRNPYERTLAGIAGGDEPGVVSGQSTGDNILQSKLFYYYWDDLGFSLGNNKRHYYYSYKEVADAGLLNATEAELEAHFNSANDTKRGSFTQDEAGGWWLGYAQDEIAKYLTTVDTEAFYKRFPDYINSLQAMKLIVEMYAGTDYHVRYFYKPAVLSEMSYTFTTIEGAVFGIPSYQYLDDSGRTVTVPRTVKYPTLVDGEWKITLSYEEIAAIEKMERAPGNCVIKDNIILGGTPAQLENNSKPMDEDNPAVGNDLNVVQTISVGTGTGVDTRGSTMIDNNFMYFTYEDIIPGAIEREYEICDYGWDLIRDAMDEDFVAMFEKLDQYKCGMSDRRFNYSYYDIYD